MYNSTYTMPKRSSEQPDDILPYKKRKLYGEFIYKQQGFFGESLIKGFIFRSVILKCNNTGYFGECFKK